MRECIVDVWKKEIIKSDVYNCDIIILKGISMFFAADYKIAQDRDLPGSPFTPRYWKIQYARVKGAELWVFGDPPYSPWWFAVLCYGGVCVAEHELTTELLTYAIRELAESI